MKSCSIRKELFLIGFIAACLVVFIFGIQTSYATAIAITTNQIDWNYLFYSTGITWKNEGMGWAEININTNTYGPVTGYPTFGLSAGSGNITGMGSFNSKILKGDAKATADGLNPNVTVSTDVKHGEDFNISGAGEYTFTVPYTATHFYSTTLPGEDTETYSGISLLLRWYEGTTLQERFDVVYLYDLISTSSGQLTVSGDLPANSINYSLETHIYTHAISYSPPTAPVPEPATILLLGSGLIGLAGVRRKFKE